MPPRRTQADRLVFQPGPAVAGYLVPGLGHLLVGERARGIIIMIALHGLFLAGLLIGGIDVIDYRHQKLWFAGQCLFSPIAPALGYVHDARDFELRQQVAAFQQSHYQKTGRSLEYDQALLHLLRHQPRSLAYIQSTGRVNEIGTLYCAMAGLLNLLAIIDVVVRPRPRKGEGGWDTDAPRGRLVTRENVR